MNKLTTNKFEVARVRADEQTNNDLQPGRGVIAMPTHDQIAHRAYDIYVNKGRQQGQCEQNWNQAERELRSDDSKP